MPLEKFENMVIMALAYAQRVNDSSFLSVHYARLKLWADLLVQYVSIPGNLIFTDDFQENYTDQVNLQSRELLVWRHSLSWQS